MPTVQTYLKLTRIIPKRGREFWEVMWLAPADRADEIAAFLWGYGIDLLADVGTLDGQGPVWTAEIDNPNVAHHFKLRFNQAPL